MILPKNFQQVNKIMKHFLICVPLFLFFATSLNAQDLNMNYDSTLAKSLSADDYGMKKYVLVMLKTGSNKTASKATRDSLFAGHMANINRLSTTRKLVLAGPLEKNDKYQGIFIFNVETLEEGKKLLESDPAYKAKIFDADLFMWYGSAAIQETLDIHWRIEKFKR